MPSSIFKAKFEEREKRETKVKFDLAIHLIKIRRKVTFILVQGDLKVEQQKNSEIVIFAGASKFGG